MGKHAVLTPNNRVSLIQKVTSHQGIISNNTSLRDGKVSSALRATLRIYVSAQMELSCLKIYQQLEECSLLQPAFTRVFSLTR